MRLVELPCWTAARIGELAAIYLGVLMLLQIVASVLRVSLHDSKHMLCHKSACAMLHQHESM